VTSSTAQAGAPGSAFSKRNSCSARKQLGIAAEVVRDLYDEEVAQLQSNAAVKNFSEIIVGLRVKAKLKNKLNSRVVS